MTPYFAPYTYSKEGGNLRLDESNNFQYFYIKSFVVGAHILEVPYQGDSNTQSQHMILWRNDVYFKSYKTYHNLLFCEKLMSMETFFFN